MLIYNNIHPCHVNCKWLPTHSKLGLIAYRVLSYLELSPNNSVYNNAISGEETEIQTFL